MSKGLDAQDIIIDMFNKYANKPNDWGEFFKFCNADEVVKKELKALEIIKELFNVKVDEEEQSIGIDNVYFIHIENKEILDLLKEVFNNE